MSEDHQLNPADISPVVDEDEKVQEQPLTQAEKVSEKPWHKVKVGGLIFEVESFDKNDGAGGMGSIYKARHIREDGQVEWKALKLNFDEFEGIVESQRENMLRTATELAFMLEAGLVDPEHALQVLNATIATFEGDIKRGVIVMEWRDAYDKEGTLTGKQKIEQATHLDKEGNTQKGMAVAEVSHILNQLGLSIDKYAEAGFLHLDLKPANLLITENNKTYIIDFGIAQRIDSSDTNPDRNPEVIQDETERKNARKGVGSVPYMSPEMIRQEKLTLAAEVYTLAKITFELLSGEPYHSQVKTNLNMSEQGALILDTLVGQSLNKNMRELSKILEAQNLDPAPIIDVLTEALSINAKDRYQSGSEFALAFSEALIKAGAAPDAQGELEAVETDFIMEMIDIQDERPEDERGNTIEIWDDVEFGESDLTDAA
jgi:serine/threonine protein kinase